MTYPIHVNAGAAYQSAGGLSGTYIPEIWSGKLLEKFYTATVFGQIANTDYEGEISKYGDKVKIRTIPNVVIRDYQIGQGLTYDRYRSDNVELLIDKGKYYGVSINKVEQKQADIDYVNKWAEDGSEQMKIAIDADILADIPADASPFNTGAAAGKISKSINLGVAAADGSTAVQLTKENIISYIIWSGQILDECNIPESNRWMVIPAWARSLIMDSQLKDASITGDGKSTLRTGRLGYIDRFELFNSNNVLPVTEGAVDCYNLLFGHKSALTFATQLVENEMIPNPNDFGQLMRGLQVYGYEVIKPESMGVLYAKK